MSKILVVLSGGQDSTTALFYAKHLNYEVFCVTFDYNQRHHREIEAARTVARLAGVASHEVVELGPVLQGRSPLTDPKQSLEQYEDFASMDKTIGDRVELTFVPMRNTLFLTVAANRAVCLDIDVISTGVCEADNANYPDCRLSFINALEVAFKESLGQPMHIFTPLIHKTKSQSIDLALSIPGCYAALGFSHTAYDGAYPPTGKDHATTLRAQGFLEAKVPDPLIVRAWAENLMDLPDTPNYLNHIDLIEESMHGSKGVIIHSGLLALEANLRSLIHDH